MKTAILKSSVVGVMLTAGAFFCEAGLAYVALANRSGRLVPDGVTRTEGLVRDPAQVLEDTVAAAYFGDPRGREQMLQPKRGAPRCMMELSLKEEFGE